MSTDTEFSDVKRRLRPGDVFQRSEHDWKTQSDRRWKGSCPWHDSDSGTCFTVNPETLEWHCFSCDRGGGPLQYVAELEGAHGGARGSLKGKEFFRAWGTLAQHAGCEGPPDFDSDTNGGRKSSDRQPLRHKGSPDGRRRVRREEARAPRRAESASITSKAGGRTSRDTPPRGGPDLDTPEQELREALVRYREALKESDIARRYVEGRGLSVGTLYRHGCGFAPAGEWIGQDNAPRLVTPHTTAPRDSSGDSRPQLVNLDGRYVGGGDVRRHDRIGGNPSALFNAAVIEEGDGPLVLCEGPFDALSFVEAGWERTVALHNTDGVPWEAIRGSAETLVFAFDRDDTGREGAAKRAREAVRRGLEAHTLHDEAAYEGHSDPNEALQAGELSLDYLHGLKEEKREAGADSPTTGADPRKTHEGDGSKNKPHARDTADSEKQSHATGADGSENKPMTDGETAGTADRENKSHDRPAEPRETAAKSSDPEADRSLTPQQSGDGDGRGGATAADLIPYWNGSDIGHLGRWLWERGGVPEGDVGAGLYADRELCKWIKEQLEAGPQATSEETQVRLRWVLWRLYAEYGPEEVPERQIPIPPMRRA